MVKKIAAVVLILLMGGGWFYLDYMNKQEQLAAEESRKAVLQARAQAQARAEAKAQFEAVILADLNNCKAAAEKAKIDYLTLNQKPVRRKPGEFTIPPAVAEEAEKTLAAANAECQLAYDTRQKNGS
jgi:type II secretory pathway pseudopilin PulG